MWRSISRKARADLIGRPLQTALVFLVVVAAGATISLAMNLQASASEPYQRLRDRAHGADAWVNFTAAGGQPSILREVTGVESIGEPYPVSWENQGIRKGTKKQQIALVGLGPSLPDFDRPVVTSGRWLTANGSRELVLDAGAARILGISVGERVSVLRASGPVEFTVVGLGATASRAPAPINDPAFAWVLPTTLYELHPGITFGESEEHALRVGVELSPGTPPIALFESARAAMGGSFNVRVAGDVERNIADANQFNVIFLRVFGVFALLASGLIVANSVGGQVLAQLRDIGILKSIGFTPRQVVGALLVQNLGLAFLASVVGALIGLLLAPLFLGQTADVLGVPSSPAFSTASLAVPVGAVLAVVIAFTLLPAWRAARIRPVVALGRGDVAPGGGISRVATFGGRLHLPRPLSIGLAALARRRGRTAFTLLALVLAVVTATFTLGIEATFDRTMADPTVIGGPPYDLAIDRDTVADTDARRMILGDPDIEELLPLYSTGARVDHLGFDVLVFEGVLDSAAWRVRSGRMPAAPGEVALSTTLAATMGASVGDRLTLQHSLPDTGSSAVSVVGTFASTEGEVMATVLGTIPVTDPPSDYYARVRSGGDARAVADRLIAASGGQLDPEILAETVADLRDSWRPLLVGLNGVLFAIAGINLTSNLMLGVRERRRELAILKTVGFTPAQLIGSVLGGSVAVACVATAIGIPVGLVATRLMFDVLSSAAGIGTGVGALPGIGWLILTVPMAIGTAALASLAPGIAAARLRVAEALRDE